MRAAEALPVSDTEADRAFADLQNLPSLILAISGGPDSTALLVLAAQWRARLPHGPELIAVTIDHALRPESAEEAQAVDALARRLGASHRILRWDGDKPAAGLQQAARHARYALLAQAAHECGARHILTAHTRDDQAETVLLRLVSGSGITGLRAMTREAPLPGDDTLTLMRPLLSLDKARLLATLRARDIAFADDASNRDPRFTRVRLRGMMPVLAQEGLTPKRLTTLAQRMLRAESAIESAVDAAERALTRATGRSQAIDWIALAREPDEIASRVLGRAIARAGGEGPAQLAKLEALHLALNSADAGTGLRRTLAGALITLKNGTLTVGAAPARRPSLARVQA